MAKATQNRAAETAAVETAAVETAAAPAFGNVIFGRKLSSARNYNAAAVIRVNPELLDAAGNIVNPKRGKAAARFAFYRDGMTVGEYVNAVTATGQKAGVATADLKFDRERNFIVTEAPAAPAVVEAPAAE